MLEKEFIPYEQALALKELGFNEPCFGYHLNNEFQFFADIRSCNTNSEFKFYPTVPTHQQAFRWFRNKYGLDGVSFYNYTGYMWNIIDVKNSNATKNVTVQEDDMQQYSSKEEAELECLIKLIEIVKNK